MYRRQKNSSYSHLAGKIQSLIEDRVYRIAMKDFTTSVYAEGEVVNVL